jgi:hypothetical protein
VVEGEVGSGKRKKVSWSFPSREEEEGLMVISKQ